jgi:hypothetical protein
VRGASALQTALDEQREAPLKVFVIWERVLFTDWLTPNTRTLARIWDPRAAQYWDRDRALSEYIRATYSGNKSELPDIIWDVVAIYPKGARWESSLPADTYFDGPVVDVMAEFRKQLSSALAQ